MNTGFNRKTLIIARESRGYTQVELSEKLNIPQSTLSKIENGHQLPDDDILQILSEGLNYPISFFLQEMDVYPPNLHYRKKTDVPAKTLSAVEAIMNIYRTNIKKLLTSINIPFTRLPFIEGKTKRLVKEAARLLRQFWNIPRGPINNLIKVIEDNGIIVISMEFGTEEIDGRGMIADNGRYIIFINKNIPGDRQRLTIAHEVGHILLHLYSSEVFEIDVEEEAKEFASEFLMPENEFKMQLSGKRVTMQVLADLKRYWKTSMQAILYWAEKLKIVTKNQAKYLWSQFYSLRIKIVEPIPIPPENPGLLNEIILSFINDLEYSNEMLAATVNLNVDDFKNYYLLNELGRLRVVR